MRKTKVMVMVMVLGSACAGGEPLGELERKGGKPKPPPAEEVVLETFLDLAEIPRPSGGEEGVVEYLIGRATETNERVGYEVVTWVTDALGNIRFRIAGSDGSTVPVVALQGHMDMVWAVANLPPGEDPAPYFENGVDLELVDGWIQSVGNQTSIGADNGMGIAMAARYMIQFEEWHPAMELLFTVNEELDLSGARDLAPELYIEAPVLIGLDEFDADTFTFGCLGNQKGFAEATYPVVAVPAGSRQLTLALTGLAGGHSGSDIEKARLNGILTAVSLARDVAALDPAGGVRVLGAGGGSEPNVNVIPSSATVVLSVPDAIADDAVAVAQASFAAALAEATDEPATASLTATLADVPAGAVGLGAEDTTRFLTTLLAVPNGPITYDPRSPNGVNTSSNIGWLQLVPEGGALVGDVGFMSRSYIITELEPTVDGNLQILSGWGPTPADTVVTEGLLTPPWFEDTETPLYLEARALLPHFGLTLASGTSEMAWLSSLFTDATLFAIGPQIENAHSPSERVELESVYRTIESLEILVNAAAGK